MSVNVRERTPLELERKDIHQIKNEIRERRISNSSSDEEEYIVMKNDLDLGETFVSFQEN